MDPSVIHRSIIRSAVTALCAALLVLAGPAAYAEPGKGQGQAEPGPPAHAQSSEAPGQDPERVPPGQAKQDDAARPDPASDAPGRAKQDDPPAVQAPEPAKATGQAKGKPDEPPGQAKGKPDEPPGQAKVDAEEPVEPAAAAAPRSPAAQSTAKPAKQPAGQVRKSGEAAAAAGASDRPRGNAGSVKVNPVGWTDDEENPPRNHPHVGCEFDVNYYGAYGSIEDVSFVAQPPSGRFVELPVQAQTVWQHDATPPPGNTLVETQRWDLEEALTSDPEITEHHQQGYHVKVTVESDREGPGNRKHKVFWVRCDGVEAQVTVSSTVVTVTQTTTAPVQHLVAGLVETTGPVEASSVVMLPLAETRPPPSPVEVLAEQLTSPVAVAAAGMVTAGEVDTVVAAPPHAQAPGALASTGAGAALQLVVGLLLVAGGAGLRRRAGTR